MSVPKEIPLTLLLAFPFLRQIRFKDQVEMVLLSAPREDSLAGTADHSLRSCTIFAC